MKISDQNVKDKLYKPALVFHTDIWYRIILFFCFDSKSARLGYIKINHKKHMENKIKLTEIVFNSSIYYYIYGFKIIFLFI